MFPFRKKTKALPSTVVRHKRGGFAKKIMTPRENHSLQREHDHQETRDSFYGLYVFLWTLFLIVTLYLLLFAPFFRLTNIRIEGAADISESSLEQFIREDVSGKYLASISKDNLLLISRAKIESDTKEHFKKIREIEITRVFPHTFVVHIQERETLVLWCVSETCFYIDENGYAYAPVDGSQSSESSGSFLKIMDMSAQTIETDDPVLDQEFVRFVAELQGKLHQELGIAVEAECATASRFSDELVLKTQEGWMMRMNVRLPIEKSLQTLRLLLKKEISQERRQHLKYIDLRTENRAYYSVEGETVSAPVITETVPQSSVAPLSEDKTVTKEKKK